jgi:predicted nucleic acid-binding protein
MQVRMTVTARSWRDCSGISTGRAVLVPNIGDWSAAGRMLARLGRVRGFEEIGRARMSNDALIAASAARMGITVITANERDFRLFGELCNLQWMSFQAWNNVG